MRIIKVIKLLQRAALKLKAYAVKQEEAKLYKAAEAFDYASELADKRIEQAERIAEVLIERAVAKEKADEDKANLARAKASAALLALEEV